MSKATTHFRGTLKICRDCLPLIRRRRDFVEIFGAFDAKRDDKKQWKWHATRTHTGDVAFMAGALTSWPLHSLSPKLPGSSNVDVLYHTNICQNQIQTFYSRKYCFNERNKVTLGIKLIIFSFLLNIILWVFLNLQIRSQRAPCLLTYLYNMIYLILSHNT